MDELFFCSGFDTAIIICTFGMKKLLSLTVFLVLTAGSGFGQIRSKVDERFELTSIMFALAGAQEYNMCGVPSYRQDIAGLASLYESSEAIEFIKKIRAEYGIGYNAVAGAADVIEIKNGKIRLQPQYHISKISEEVDPRWNEEIFREYMKMVNVFYKESDFSRFYEEHSALYCIAEERMDALLAKIHPEWFESFYGKPFDPELNVYVSLTNGPGNYAIPSGILIGTGSDGEGVPYYGDGMIAILMHEFGHHYTNPLFDAWWSQMEVAAVKIYPYVEDQMRQNAYSGAKTTLCEWLNNLFVLMYYKEYDPKMVRGRSSADMQRGFIWMERGVEFMENFYAYRNLYPHIEDFMLQMVAFLDYTAMHFDRVEREYKNSRPFVTNVFPAIGTDISGFNEIVVTFSEPMLGSWGTRGEENYEESNVTGMQHIIDDIQWSDDFKQAHILIDRAKMKPNSLYKIELEAWGFQSARYFPLDNRCKYLQFITAKQ